MYITVTIRITIIIIISSIITTALHGAPSRATPTRVRSLSNNANNANNNNINDSNNDNNDII